MLKPALLVIDVQKGYVAASSRPVVPDLSEFCDVVNTVAREFRTKGWPVIWIQDESDFLPGDPRFELVEGLDAHETDHRIVKRHCNAFRGTSLAARLDEAGVNLSVLAGWKAEFCVLSTVKGFEDRDRDCVVLRDCILGTDSTRVEFVEKTSPLMSWHAVFSLLKNLP